MRFTKELVLGYRFHDFNKLASFVPEHLLADLHKDDSDLTLNDDDLRTLYEEAFTDIVILSRPTVQKLIEEFPVLLAKAGFEIDPADAQRFTSGDSLSLLVQTPLGPRDLSRIQFETYYEPYHLGETIQDSVIGFRLSGLKSPIFLDWKNPEGGLTNFVLDEEVLRFTRLAKEFIASKLPAFADAELIFRDVRY